jgi:hypothetical protein
MKIPEIKEIPFSICEHSPRAQSICEPDEILGYNEFCKNIQKQILNIYESTRSIETQERLWVSEENSNNY